MPQLRNKQLEYPLSGSFTGSLLGTASYATNSNTASFVVSSSYSLSSSYSITSSYSVNSTSASYALSSSNSISASYSTTASYSVSSSQAQNANTASYALESKPAGNSGEIQYNNGGVMSADVDLTFDGTKNILFVGKSNTAPLPNNLRGAIVQGASNTIQGIYSQAQGFGVSALGDASRAQGTDSISLGNNSQAAGEGVIASGSAQTVIGKYNTHGNDTALFTIGNGTDDLNRTDLVVFGPNDIYVSGSISLETGYNITADRFYGNLIGNADTADTATNADTASFVTGSNVYGPYGSNSVVSASYALSSSFAITATNADTASNILGGVATHVPYFITDTTLATSSIYQSGSTSVIINQNDNTTANPEALYVWQPHPTSINVISGKGLLNNYLQLNIQNTDNGISASSDIVATANNGSETEYYIDMGINGESYGYYLGGPNDAYLYAHANNLWIGNVDNGKQVYFFNSSSLQPIITLNADNAQITGSLYGSSSYAITASYSDASISASYSLRSTSASYASSSTSASYSVTASYSNRSTSASYALTATSADSSTSASHAIQADNADFATYADIAGNGGVTRIINGSGISILPLDGKGDVTIISSGGGGVTILSGSNVTQSFNNSNTWTFDHNQGVRTPIITTFDSNYNQIIPQNIELTNTSSATITFPEAVSGFAIASLGGTTGTVLSSSYSLFSTYATTASYFDETDPVFVAKSASLATTGSNIFRGNQIVTGSLFTTGSNTLVGNTSLTGSLRISGSTTQIGNNTLIGTTILTGSIFINGDIIPEVSSSFDLGSETNPWRSVYVQSGSISIQSDIPGGIPAIISNANGNITFAGAGFQLKSGSFVPFEISSSARTVIRVPNIPANDLGGLSIIGSSDGSFQGVTNPGGLIHLTSNDGASSRITSDAYGTASNAAYVGRKARGTAASPLPVQAGDILTRISSVGWTGPDYGFTMSASLITAPTSIDVVALDNFTTSSFGTRFNFYNPASGNTIRTLSAQIDTTGVTIPSSSRFFGTASWASNAQTASFLTIGTYNITSSQAVSSSFAATASYVNPLKQDVIITGSLQITGSGYINGLPILTSANTSSFSDGFGWYGVFCSTGSQTNPVGNVSRSMQLDTTEHSNGVSLVSGSRITFAHAGVYNIQFSAQLEKTSNGTETVYIWFKKNGTNVARSNSNVDLAKAAGGNGKLIASWNYVDTFNPNDYYEVVWQSSDITMQLYAAAATGNLPATPSVIITATQVG